MVQPPVEALAVVPAWRRRLWESGCRKCPVSGSHLVHVALTPAPATPGEAVAACPSDRVMLHVECTSQGSSASSHRQPSELGKASHVALLSTLAAE